MYIRYFYKGGNIFFYIQTLGNNLDKEWVWNDEKISCQLLLEICNRQVVKIDIIFIFTTQILAVLAVMLNVWLTLRKETTFFSCNLGGLELICLIHCMTVLPYAYHKCWKRPGSKSHQCTCNTHIMVLTTSKNCYYFLNVYYTLCLC